MCAPLAVHITPKTLKERDAFIVSTVIKEREIFTLFLMINNDLNLLCVIKLVIGAAGITVEEGCSSSSSSRIIVVV